MTTKDREEEILTAIFARSRSLTAEMAKEENLRFAGPCKVAYEALKKLGTLQSYPGLGHPDNLADPPDSDYSIMREAGQESLLVSDYMALDGAIAVVLRLVRDDYDVENREWLLEEIRECMTSKCVDGDRRW